MVSDLECANSHQPGKMDQLVKELDRQPSVDMVGIEEHRWITTDSIAHNCIAKSYRTAERISDCILEGNLMVAIVVVYALTEVSEPTA